MLEVSYSRVQSPFPVIVLASGVGFCDFRKVQVLQAAKRMGLLSNDYVWIIVQVQEDQYASVVCTGDLQQYTSLYVDAFSNVLLVGQGIGVITAAATDGHEFGGHPQHDHVPEEGVRPVQLLNRYFGRN